MNPIKRFLRFIFKLLFPEMVEEAERLECEIFRKDLMISRLKTEIIVLKKTQELRGKIVRHLVEEKVFKN